MEFTLPEICKITGVTKHRLHQWLRLGYISPSVKAASKPGDWNIFNQEDLYRCAIFKYFLQSGWTREIAAKLVTSIKEDDFKRLSSIWKFDAMNMLKWWYQSDEGKKDTMRLIAKGSGRDIEEDVVKAAGNLAAETTVKAIERRSSKISLYLVFLQTGYMPVEFQCLAMGQNLDEFKNEAGVLLMSGTVIADFSELMELTKHSAVAHLINWEMVIEPVDSVAMELFPHRYADEGDEITRKASGNRLKLEQHISKRYGRYGSEVMNSPVWDDSMERISKENNEKARKLNRR